jgi:hypothetical protein
VLEIIEEAPEWLEQSRAANRHSGLEQLGIAIEANRGSSSGTTGAKFREEGLLF